MANQPALALVDTNSYWVHGYFRETLVGGMKAGDPAVITLISHPDAPLTGAVDSIGWGIAQQDGSTGICSRASAPPSSGSAWPSGHRYACTWSRCRRAWSCASV